MMSYNIKYYMIDDETVKLVDESLQGSLFSQEHPLTTVQGKCDDPAMIDDPRHRSLRFDPDGVA